MNNEGEQLIITGSFDGLLGRVAKMDHFGLLLTGKKILTKAKKERVEATMRMSEVQEMTGLTREDVEFFVSLRLISVIEAGGDPLLSFKDVFCLAMILERFVGEGVILSGVPRSRRSKELQLIR